ncbi:Lrp/AsnC family transcriptional regulator [Glutamicibacter sp. NPDC087344]|uniref:Lrp/AsnC family transcriptional regulator n=1 Tax=Glutamicibacter sp. NPDC087344 TaxID=3363994 RepID=UPI003805C37C
MQDFNLTELDLQIIHAVQLDPRIPWRGLASVLDVDQATLARRWARIEHEGYAWISAIPGPRMGSLTNSALVEFDCEPGRALEVADYLSRESQVTSIDLTAGGRDFIATLLGADDVAFADYLLDLTSRVPGLRDVRSHPVTRAFKLGSDWSVQTLSPEQQRRLPAPRGARPASAKHLDDHLVERLIAALSVAPRASYADLGERLGVSAQRASDILARGRELELITLRADVAATVSGWPVVAWFFIQVPAQTLLRHARLLAELPSLQFAAGSMGASNLIVAAGARAKHELLALEADLEQRLPGARIIDRSLVLRVHKHLGRIMRPDGRGTATQIPLGLFAP